jgi:hypothetical protein
MTFKSTGSTERNIKDLRTKSQLVEDALLRGAWISGKELVKDITSRMTKKDKSGRKYLIYKGIGGVRLKNPRLHTASAPLEYPAVITGKLRKSTDFEVTGKKQLTLGFRKEGFDFPYGKLLEEGGGKIKARKPIAQTVKRLGNQVETNISKEIEKD